MTMTRHIFVTLLIILIVPASLLAGDASQYRGDPSKTGATTEKALLPGASALSVLWEGNVTTGKVKADPLVIGEDLIIVSEGGDILCLDILTGNPRWSKNVGAGIAATPAAYQGKLIVGTTAGNLSAYRLANGDLLWSAQPGGHQIGAVTVADGKVIVAPGFGNGNLLAYNAEDGSVVWARPLTRDTMAPAAVYGDKVVVVQPDGMINCFNLADGLPAWAGPVETQGIFYGTTPTIALDPDSGDVLVFAFPGDAELSATTTISGYKGYAMYRVKLADGTYSRIIPGNQTSYAATARGGSGAVEDVVSENALDYAPPELREQLTRLSDLDTMLRVIEQFERDEKTDYSTLKTVLRKEFEQQKAWRDSINLSTPGEGRSSATARASLPGSSLDPLWPTSVSVRPGPVSYLARGSQRYLTVMMRELPKVTVTPRTMLFCLNPATFGEARWYYVSSQLETPTAINSQGTLIVPNATDPNGAYVLAPLGRNIGIFDAAAGNTPIFEIEMPGVVYPTPVLANGRLVVVDTGGYAKVFATTDNAPPQAPALQTPAEGTNLQTLTSPVATWTASLDESAPANVSYTVRYAINGDIEIAYTEASVSAGTTSFDWGLSLPADSLIMFAVQAIDERGAAGRFSSTRSFYFQKDVTAPADVTNLAVTPGPLSLRVTFNASADEAPNGTADVTGYRLEVTDIGAGALAFAAIDLGLAHTLDINGADPSTLLNATKTYSVKIIAIDHRGNESAGASVSAQPQPPSSTDVFPPRVLTARLQDVDRNGYIETVVVEFSENLGTGPNVAGFFLASERAVSATGPSGTLLTLKFGAGSQGTELKELTYDAGQGSVLDLAGNALASFVAADVTETDEAAPVLLRNTVQMYDDDNDTRPNRITVKFSEQVAAASVDSGDIRNVADSAGTGLTVTGIALLPDLLTLEISLDDSKGVMGDATFDMSDDGDGVFFRDTVGNTATADVTNRPPQIVVSPSANAFAPGLVEFSARGSTDPDGNSSRMNYYWTVEFSSAAVLPVFYPSNAAVVSGRNANDAALIVVQSGSYALRLRVEDEQSGVSEAFISFSINNVAPVAVAGPDIDVPLGATVRFDGVASSDVNSSRSYQDIAVWQWTIVSQPNGAGATLLNGDTIAPDFNTSTALPGEYAVQLTVTDAAGASSVDVVKVRVHDAQTLLVVADAGPDRLVPTGEPFNLDGRFSHGATANRTYAWSQVSGPAVLSAVSDAIVAVTASQPGVYEFLLTVSDGTFQDTDNVFITAHDRTANVYVPNLMATVPDTADRGVLFTIDASKSIDVDGGVLRLDIRHDAGPQLLQVGSGDLKRDYVAQEAGVAEFSLCVTDGVYSSVWRPYRIAIGVENNTRPVPALTNVPSLVTAGTQATLDFTGSTDAEGAALAMKLVQVSGPAPAELSAVAGKTATFTAGEAGVYTFDLFVRDDVHDALPIRFNIVAEESARHLPQGQVQPATVNADLKQSATVQLSGSATDADGTGVDYLWVQIGGPTATINSPTSANTSIDLPNLNNTYQFELFADDGALRCSIGMATVTTQGGVDTPGTGGTADPTVGGCALLSGLYGQVGLPLLVLGVILVIVALRLASVYRRKTTDQSI